MDERPRKRGSQEHKWRMVRVPKALAQRLDEERERIRRGAAEGRIALPEKVRRNIITVDWEVPHWYVIERAGGRKP